MWRMRSAIPAQALPESRVPAARSPLGAARRTGTFVQATVKRYLALSCVFPDSWLISGLVDGAVPEDPHTERVFTRIREEPKFKPQNKPCNPWLMRSTTSSHGLVTELLPNAPPEYSILGSEQSEAL